MVAIGVMISYFINRLVHILPYDLDRAHTIIEQLASGFTWQTAPKSGEFLSGFSLSQLV
jgi:uncharacterized membrane protein YgaE (UPF0421/DUF939 family)